MPLQMLCLGFRFWPPALPVPPPLKFRSHFNATSLRRPSLRPLTKVDALCYSEYLGPLTAFYVRGKVWLVCLLSPL